MQTEGAKGGTLIIRTGRELHILVVEAADGLGMSIQEFATRALANAAHETIQRLTGQSGQHADDVLSESQTERALQ